MTNQSGLQRAITALGATPSFAASAPGRVNLIGDHTDYNGGLVMPMAIDRRCFAVGLRNTQPRRAAHAATRIIAADLGESFDFDPAAMPAHFPRWAGYAAGVCALWATRFNAEELRGLTIAIASDVPLGSGLSSSASLEVAVATALEAATGRTLAPIDKALLCQQAEHRWAGVPCGLMDQLASVSGRAGHALLMRFDPIDITPVPLPPTIAVLIVNTGVHHELAAGEYAARRLACEAAAARLGVPNVSALRGDEPSLGDSAPLVRHVVTENARVEAFAAALHAGDLAAAGRRMTASHTSLRDDYRVSCRELDTAVASLIAAPGVYGARMTGGGFGGCAVALCDEKNAAAASVAGAAAIKDLHAIGASDATAFIVHAAAGAAALDPAIAAGNAGITRDPAP